MALLKAGEIVFLNLRVSSTEHICWRRGGEGVHRVLSTMSGTPFPPLAQSSTNFNQALLPFLNKAYKPNKLVDFKLNSFLQLLLPVSTSFTSINSECAIFCVINNKTGVAHGCMYGQ